MFSLSEGELCPPWPLVAIGALCPSCLPSDYATGLWVEVSNYNDHRLNVTALKNNLRTSTQLKSILWSKMIEWKDGKENGIPLICDFLLFNVLICIFHDIFLPCNIDITQHVYVYCDILRTVWEWKHRAPERVPCGKEKKKSTYKVFGDTMDKINYMQGAVWVKKGIFHSACSNGLVKQSTDKLKGIQKAYRVVWDPRCCIW